MSGEFEGTSHETYKLIIDEAEFDDYVNRPEGSPGTRLGNISIHYGKLAELPGIFSQNMNIPDISYYVGMTMNRWQSLFKALGDKYDDSIIPEGANKLFWVIEELERYAERGEVQSVSAAMLIKYLEGSPPSGISRILGRKLGDNYAEMLTIRDRFIRFIGTADSEIKPPSRSKNQNIGAVSVATALADPAVKEQPLPEIKRDTTIERSRLAKLLTQYLTGNKGAYQEMLSLTAEVIVNNEHRSQARASLFEVVGEMVRPSVSNKLPDNLKLDIATEASWLMLFCGKELVEIEGSWFSKNSRPYTLQGIRDYVFRERTGGKLSLSPNQVETKVLTALSKVIEYKKLIKPSG